MTAFTVSQPQRTTHSRAPGKRLPRCPKTALDSAIPGAPPRLPATDTRPTSPKERTDAMTATASTCHTFSPLKTVSPAPTVSSSTVRLAVTQVGKRVRTRPVRS